MADESQTFGQTWATSYDVVVASTAAILWLVGSLSPNWSDVSLHSWRQNYELIWVAESAIVIAAAICSYWSPRCATALLLPAIVFRAISLSQFYVPKNGFSGHATGYMTVSWIGLGAAVLGFIMLTAYAKPFWGLTRSSLIVTMALFVVAIGWSVAAALPWVHNYLRAPPGHTWKSNGQQVLEYNCCLITSTSLTLGAKITTWAQVLAAPLLVFIAGLRAGKTVQGLGWIAAGVVMTAVGLSILQTLGPIPPPPQLAGSFGTASILPAGVCVIVGGAIVLLVGVANALWTVASRVTADAS